MKKKWLPLPLMALFASGALGLSLYAATAHPAEEKKPAKVRLVLPWSKLTTLTPDQKQKIADLHRQSLEARKQILAKEKADILALLSDAQKRELQQILDQQTLQRKLRQAERRKKAESKREGDSGADRR